MAANQPRRSPQAAAVSLPVEVARLVHPESVPREAVAYRRWVAVVAVFGVYSALAVLWWAFRTPDVLQDDGRQHLFWMQRFTDPALFPNDPSANYFQTFAPAGYSALYWALARVGVAPLLAAKLLPPLLLLITVRLTFQAGRAIFRDPAAAGMGALLYLQVLATNDDLCSATPRAFIAPLLAGFVLTMARRQVLGALLCVALMGVFYPQLSLVLVAAVAVLKMARWRGRDGETASRRLLPAAALTVLAVAGLTYHSASQVFGPLVSQAQARSLPEFGVGGRTEFFVSNPLQFWLIGDRSGLLPLVYHSPLLWAGFAFPFLVRKSGEPVAGKVRILAALMGASLLFYALAHLLLFKLHLPSRYVRHTLLFTLSLAAGPVLAAAWEHLRSLPARDRRRRLLPAAALGLFLIPSLLVPLWNTGMVVGQASLLYRFFRATPKGAVVASLAEEGDNLPVFAARSTLVSRQATLPYHRGYYGEMRNRMVDLVGAQYTSDPAELLEVVRKYGIAYFLLDRDAFTADYLTRRPWLRTMLPPELAHPVVPRASYLERVLPRVTVLNTGAYRIVDARLLQDTPGGRVTHSKRRPPGDPPGSGAAPEARRVW